MASTFSPNLSIELIGTGDQAGTWGTTTNSNLGTLIEQAISGYVTQAVATGTDTTITIPNGVTGVARNMYIELTGTGGTNTNLIVPANKKLYFIFNNSSGAVTVKVSGQTGVSVPTGKKMVLVSNGTDIVNGLNYIADFGTNSFTVTNLTASSGTITNLIATSGSITNLVSSDASATVLRAGSATLTHLSATSASITNLSLTSLTISSLSITNVSVASATVSSNLTLSGGTASGVVYLNGSKVATSGSALTFDGTTLGSTGLIVSTNRGQFKGNSTTGFAGGGVEIGYTGTIGIVNSYDRTASAYKDLQLYGADIYNYVKGSSAIWDIAGSNEVMRLTSTGLGIGTSSPAQKLNVNGIALFEGSAQGNIIIQKTGTNGFSLFSDAAGKLGFYDQNGAATRMLIDSSGNLGIGTTTIGSRVTIGDPGTGLSFTNATATSGFNIGLLAGTGSAQAYVFSRDNAALLFGTNNAERARITSGGIFLIGTTTASGGLAAGGLEVNDRIAVSTGSVGTPALHCSTDTNTGIYYPAADTIGFSTAGTERARITSGGLFQVIADGANSTFTSGGQIALKSNGNNPYISWHQSTGALLGYLQMENGGASTLSVDANQPLVFRTNATERARITSGGSFLVGTTNTDPVGGNTPGVSMSSGGVLGASADGAAPFVLNRKTNDGILVAFYQDAVQEGNISVSGNTVSYNAFAGSHWSQLQDGSKPDILRGTVMESINELCVWPDETNERLPKSKVSDTAGSKKVYGVFMAWDNDWTATNDMLVTSVGAFICRVNGSVTVQEGDLLESNGDGTARVQADDIIRSSTIGKVTSTVKTHQYADGSYCVPTVLYCG